MDQRLCGRSGPHAAGRLVGIVPEAAAQRFDLLEDAIDVLEHGFTSLCEPHAMARPDEQRSISWTCRLSSS